MHHEQFHRLSRCLQSVCYRCIKLRLVKGYYYYYYYYHYYYYTTFIWHPFHRWMFKNALQYVCGIKYNLFIYNDFNNFASMFSIVCYTFVAYGKGLKKHFIHRSTQNTNPWSFLLDGTRTWLAPPISAPHLHLSFTYGRPHCVKIYG